MGIKHTKVSVIPDGANTSLVRPSNWNADHTIDGDVDFQGFDALNVGNAAIEGPPGPEGPEGPTGPQGSPGGNEQYYINVKDFGATGDGVTDDTTSIQDAIDYAYANEFGTVYIPSGSYKTTDTIWLDPPLNGRVNDNPPSLFNFTLRLEGDGFGGSQFPGTVIFCNHNDIGLCVGPGQHMGVRHLAIIGPNNFVGRFSQLPQVAGIRVMAGPGGAHVTNIEDCSVNYYRYGYQIGGNYDSLGDSTTLTKCEASNCEVGYMVMASQQFINALHDCTMVNCKIGVWSFFNLAVEVTGGNLSCDFGGIAIWDCDTWSGLLAAGAADNSDKNSYTGAAELKTFTVHLPGTGTGITGNPNFAQQIVEQDIFAIKTDHFGIVPFYKVEWNDGTDTLTLQLVGDWFATWLDSGAGYDPTAYWADFVGEVQAATQIYAAQYVTVFRSAGIYAKDVHVENANTVVRLMRVVSGWQVSVDGKLENIYLNWDPSNAGSTDPTNVYHALNVLTVVWPFLQVDDGCGVYVDNIRGGGGSRCLYYVGSRGSQFNNCDMDVNVLGPRRQNYGFQTTHGIETAGRGWGDWNRNPFYIGFTGTGSNVEGANDNGLYHFRASRTPFVGYMPAPWVLPRLTTTQLDALSGTITLGTNDSFADYTTGPICGDCLYRIGDYASSAGAPTLVRFNHTGWSWGADITTNWEHGAGSPFIYMDDDGIRNMFAGLRIGLPYAGPFTEYYTVCAVHHQYGYVQVQATGLTQPGWFGGPALTGVKTGSVIHQEAFSITRIGDIHAAALTDTHIAGKHYYVGDKIWQSAPSAGTSMGWVCTTAGIAGAGAVFKAMANLT